MHMHASSVLANSIRSSPAPWRKLHAAYHPCMNIPFRRIVMASLVLIILSVVTLSRHRTLPLSAHVFLNSLDVNIKSSISSLSSSSSSSSSLTDNQLQQSLSDHDDEDYTRINTTVLETFKLHWRADGLRNASVTRHAFEYGLGARDHLIIHTPLCFDLVTGTAIPFAGATLCSGLLPGLHNRRFENCDLGIAGMAVSDTFLKFTEPVADVSKLKGGVQWVDGTTVLQRYRYAGGNIAHYMAEVLFLHHVLVNLEKYGVERAKVRNMLIKPTQDEIAQWSNNNVNVLLLLDEQLQSRFVNPQQYNFYHAHTLQAVLEGRNATMGTFQDFFQQLNLSRTSPDRRSVNHMLFNFSTNSNSSDYNANVVSHNRYVCFKRAIMPGFLKSRFFINDFEYPSSAREHVSTVVPRDRLKLTQQLDTFFGLPPIINDKTKKKKHLVLLNRVGRRRVFDATSQTLITTLLQKLADSHGWRLTIADFKPMTFRQQYELMRDVSVAVGIHGANLVNTMFMPPRASALLEIMPFGFMHDMYERGGNAGVHYRSYSMRAPCADSKVGDFANLSSLYDNDISKCIRRSVPCKLHYREACLSATTDDMVSIERILETLIK